MMKGTAGGAVAATVAMQESFGCTVANRFYQLLDDESDPFDVLREAELRRRQRKERDKAAAGGGRERRRPGPPDAPAEPPQPDTAGTGPWVGGSEEETALRARRSESPPGGTRDKRSAAPGLRKGNGREGGLRSHTESEMEERQRRAPKRGEQQGFNIGAAKVKQDKTVQRKSFREYRSYETGRQTEFSVERNKNMTGNLFRPIEKLDPEKPVRDRGGRRGGMRGRGRGGGITTSFSGFGQRGKWEFERHSGNDKLGMQGGDKKGGSGARNWGTVKGDMSVMQQTAPMVETAGTAEEPGASEGEPLNKVAEGEPMEEVVQEMTLDEWKNLQQKNRPKPEFNIRKPESTFPSKAVVIHKSKYSNDLQKDYCEDVSHVFRRLVNDITSQLDINFGSLSRPGRGSRGTRGGRGRGRGKEVEETGPQPEVVQLIAPNPNDPEDFPALA